MKSRGKACAGPACHKEPFLRLPPVEHSGQSLTCHRPELDGGAFSSQRQSAEQAEKTAGKLGRQHLFPILRQFSGYFSLHLGDTAPGYHRSPFYQSANHICHEKQNHEPTCDPYGVAPDIFQHNIQPFSRIRQCNPVQQHQQPSHCTYKKALSDQDDRKALCPFNGM